MQRILVWSLLMVYLGVLLPTCAGNVKVVSNEVEAQKPIQLKEGTFDSEIRRVPSSYGVIVEFYAHWYAPEALSCSIFAFAFFCTQRVCYADQVPHLPGISTSI